MSKYHNTGYEGTIYTLYVTGGWEHDLVHTMKKHEDFIPELYFILKLNGDVIGISCKQKRT